ncbi:MAG: hypothetical protein WEC35_03495 [Nitrosopumilaceae archaeon]
MKLKILVSVSVIAILTIIAVYFYIVKNSSENEKSLDFSSEVYRYPPDHAKLFRVYAYEKDFQSIGGGNQIPLILQFELKPELTEVYREIGLINETQNTVAIIPIFTASAYADGGFYDYYKGRCDTRCLTTKILDESSSRITSSANAIKILRLLGYSFITDIAVDTNPLP